MENVSVINNKGLNEFETASDMVKKITVGWNLGNTLDCTGNKIIQNALPAEYEKAWGNPTTTKEMMIAVKEAGFNAVRVPVTYNGHFDKEGNIDKTWLDRVEEVINYVIDQDMYCITNLHHDTGAHGWLKASAASFEKSSIVFKTLWEQIALRFKDYTYKLLFESFNEIIDETNNWNFTDKAGNKAVNDLNRIFVDTVRASGGNNKIRNLVANTYVASPAEANMKNYILPKDISENHLIIEVHNYDPQGFTWTNAPWTTVRETWGTSEDKEALDKVFTMLKKYSDLYKAPVIIGEWGSQDKNNDSERAKHGAYFVKAAAECNIKCFWWDDGGGFKLLDRQNRRFIHTEIVEAMINASLNNN